jgi:hypothetical protein
MIDLVQEYPSLEKEITRYIKDRVSTYMRSRCRQMLGERVQRLNSSWDMQIGNLRRAGNRKYNQQQFLGQISYPLVKQQMLVRRAIFGANFRADPIFTLSGIGNTPQENAVNMQDLLQSNNEQIEFRPRVLAPSNDMVSKWGVAVIYTEYAENQVRGWRTIADPVMGAKRVHGVVIDTKNAQCHVLDPLNYFQNPNVVDCDKSDFKGHIERQKLSWLVDRINSHPEVYIKENIEKVVKQVKAQNHISEFYYDPQQRQSRHDFDRIAINDIIRGQFQIHLEGNEDDSTYYYVEMVGDTIIRFQDNPYDMNLDQYTVMTCEPRYDFWWGNTPAEYSINNENSLNLLLGLSIENALESMRRYIFYNKNAIDPNLWNHVASNGKIPVDVTKDVNLNNLLFTYQVPDASGKPLSDAYARILENDQRLSSSPDLSRPTSMGGLQNKTATAANIMTNKGDNLDADILERYSYCVMQVGRKESVILAQFLGNFGPIMIRPGSSEVIRMVRKENITGNYQFAVDTALQKSYQGEMLRYQNVVTWLLNLTNSGMQLPVNFVPLVQQVLRMAEIKDPDAVLSANTGMQQQQGYQPSMPMPGQEMAGAGQEMPQQPAQAVMA